MHNFHAFMGYFVALIGYANLILGTLCLFFNIGGNTEEAKKMTKISFFFGILLVYCFHNLAPY